MRSLRTYEYIQRMDISYSYVETKISVSSLGVPDRLLGFKHIELGRGHSVAHFEMVQRLESG